MSDGVTKEVCDLRFAAVEAIGKQVGAVHKVVCGNGIKGLDELVRDNVRCIKANADRIEHIEETARNVKRGAWALVCKVAPLMLGGGGTAAAVWAALERLGP